VAGKSTRITVDLGSEKLVKAVRIAAVEQGRTVRDIVAEALSLWLAGAGIRDGSQDGAFGVDSTQIPHTENKDYFRMMESLNRHRGDKE